MKTFAGIRVLVYFIVLWVASIISGWIPQLNDFWFFMTVAIASSWFLLKMEGKKLSDIRTLPRKKADWAQLTLGTLAGCVLLLITAVITLFLTGDQWRFNLNVDWIQVAIIFLTCFWSSIVQEFIFRGYPFQTLMQHYGKWTAQILIIIPFALMHMHNGMGITTILITLLTTGLGSLLFGLAYIKTRHLALPIGLHLGWNFAQALIPRTNEVGKTTLLVVTGNMQHYTFFNVVLPYVIVMLIGIIITAQLTGPIKTANNIGQ